MSYPAKRTGPSGGIYAGPASFRPAAQPWNGRGSRGSRGSGFPGRPPASRPASSMPAARTGSASGCRCPGPPPWPRSPAPARRTGEGVSSFRHRSKSGQVFAPSLFVLNLVMKSRPARSLREVDSAQRAGCRTADSKITCFSIAMPSARRKRSTPSHVRGAPADRRRASAEAGRAEGPARRDPALTDAFDAGRAGHAGIASAQDARGHPDDGPGAVSPLPPVRRPRLHGLPDPRGVPVRSAAPVIPTASGWRRGSHIRPLAGTRPAQSGPE